MARTTVQANIDYEAMGSRIKSMRLSKGLLQTEVAKKLGLSQTHMSNLERGRTGITLENMAKLVDIFDCSIDYLVFGTPDRRNDAQDEFLRNCSIEDVVKVIKCYKLFKNEGLQE